MKISRYVEFMNFTHSMRQLLSILTVWISLSTFAQSSSNNPVSFFGLGEKANGNHSIYNSLGKNDFNFFDSTQLNFYNPASYSTLSAGNTLYSLDVQSRVSQYTQNGASEYGTTFLVEHFAIGFKMKRRMGLSFGLRPYATRGYSFSEKVYVGTDSLKYTYSGKGGIQNLYLGLAYAPIQTKSSRLSLGVNASYIFGNVANERQSLLLSTSTFQGGLGKNVVFVKAFHYEFGLSFKQNLGKKNNITLSTVVEPTQKFNATYREELYTSSNINTPSVYDTLVFNSQSGKITSNLTYRVGINYQLNLPSWKRKTRTLHPAFNLLASYSSLGTFSHNFSSINQWNLVQGNRLSVGLQFTPELKMADNVSALKFLEKIYYRVGYYHQDLLYAVNGYQFTEKAVSVGLGIPLLMNQSLSSVNLSVALGNRGTVAPNSIQESFLGVNFGLILAPSVFERWFRKRKLD